MRKPELMEDLRAIETLYEAGMIDEEERKFMRKTAEALT